MLKVLIVDDMDIARRELKRLKLWERNGLVISGEAKNGQEALEMLEEAAFDIVITDIRMPKVDGIELLKKIAERSLCQCVILCSDYSEFRYARQGLILGAFDYIVKPVAEEELEALMKRAREHIADKRLERQKILKLEKSLKEKVDVYFPHAEVDQLIGAVGTGDAKAHQYAANIVDLAVTSLNGDPVKVKSLVNSILYQVKNKILERYKWLDKFIGAEEIGTYEFREAVDASSVKAAFISEIKRLVNLLGSLEPTVPGGGMLEQVCSFILENVDEEISLSKVSEALFLNKSYISGSFKQKKGVSFVEYLTAVKMERAKKLIRDGNIKVYEIGALLGFKDTEYFSRLFKKYSGISPSEYRQSIQKNYL